MQSNRNFCKLLFEPFFKGEIRRTNASEDLRSHFFCYLSKLKNLFIFLLASFASTYSTSDSDVKAGKNIYWVGHSLITSVDPYHENNQTLPEVLKSLANGEGQYVFNNIHAQPGAPLQANWGQANDIWPNGYSQLPPLIDPKHPQFGTYNAIVLTEGIDLQATMDERHSPFYARQFYCAAIKANPNTKLYLYESWHHFQASDEGFRKFYGPLDRWNFQVYNSQASTKWTKLASEAAKPRLFSTPLSYKWQGPKPDPGVCKQTLEIKIIPVGPALVALLNRIKNPKDNDNFEYLIGSNGSHLVAEDLFANPYLDFPANQKLFHKGDPDDVHPSHILVYLSAVVHYSVLFESSPIGLPAINGVPPGIAAIIQEIAWETVSSDPRTGLKKI